LNAAHELCGALVRVESCDPVKPDSKLRIPPFVIEQLASTCSRNSFAGSPLQPEKITSLEPLNPKIQYIYTV
jgi:hypothetical protein